MSLAGKVALVTGASRGIGRGIALQLGKSGAKVYITGRPPQSALGTKRDGLPSLELTAQDVNDRGGEAVAVYTDHSDSAQVKALFDRISKENNGVLDILVNNAYSGVTQIFEGSTKKFYELDPEIWDDINNVGLRNHYFCAVFASRLMVPRRQGLIVNVSSAGGLTYIFNVAYGIGKTACDRMAADMAVELEGTGVSIVSLWPGTVKTELSTQLVDASEHAFQDTKDLSGEKIEEMFRKGESIEFAGKAVVALATDPKINRRSGNIVLTADLGDEFGFTDVDGRRISSMRSLKYLLETGIVAFPGSSTLAYLIPRWVKIPGPVITGVHSHL